VKDEVIFVICHHKICNFACRLRFTIDTAYQQHPLQSIPLLIPYHTLLLLLLQSASTPYFIHFACFFFHYCIMTRLSLFWVFALIVWIPTMTKTVDATERRFLKSRRSNGSMMSKGSKGTAAPTVSAVPTAASKGMEGSKGMNGSKGSKQTRRPTRRPTRPPTPPPTLAPFKDCRRSVATTAGREGPDGQAC
jgi:hypothetical protein